MVLPTRPTPLPNPAVRDLRPFRGLATLGLLLFVQLCSGQSDTLLTSPGTDTTAAGANPRLPVFTITADDLDSELGSQDISGILQSSRDVFTATAGFNFGQARFRIRGYDSENTLVSINGVMVNDLETGWASWSNWAGLNDVTRWMQVRSGTGPSRFNFGGIGGYTEINVRPSDLRKGLRVSYASANRAYRNRIMATYNTGMQANGWAFSISGSRRWADEGYIDGTSFDAWAYFAAAEKKINDRHTISFSGFGAPIIQGRQGLATQEAYDLSGGNYYNPNWGYQDGEKRNARMSFDHKPMLLATHTFTPDSKTKWTTSLFYTFGRDGQTNLNWFDAKDPRPDYYRYLPSYYTETNPGVAADLTSSWQNNGGQQIDWDQLYFANGKNTYSVLNADGIAGNTVTGLRSKYIVEEQRMDPTRMGLNSVYSTELEGNAHLTFGASYNHQKTHYFKTVDDLLGGDFWVDIDQFADRDFGGDTTIIQNDLDQTNKLVRGDDVFGYDYDMKTTLWNVFGQYEKKLERVDLYLGGSLGHMGFYRDGHMRNGRFPENSEGASEHHNFLHFGVKGGATYKLSGRQFIAANAAFLTRPPSPHGAFLSPRINDRVISGLQNESMYSGDINYIVRFPRLKGRATLYYTKIMNQIWSRSYYNDEYLTLVNYSMTGVDQVHKGVEIGLEANLTSTWQATFVFGGGSYLYDSRPTATITQNNSPDVFATDRTVYWKNYRVGGMPQTAGSIGVRYNSPKFWFAGVNANYFDDIYLDPNPDRRTVEAIGNYYDSDPQWNELLEQTKLDANMTLDMFAGKSWMVQRKYRIAVNLTVSNLLNNQEFQIGGFEQLRYDRTDVGRFPPKYSYLFGRNYFAMVTFSF